jgi:hypothetical protein
MAVGQAEEMNVGFAPLASARGEEAIKTIELHVGTALEAIHRERPEDLQTHAGIYGGAITAAKEFLGELVKLEADRNFTPEGKRSKLEAAGRKALEVASKFGATAETLEKQLADADEAFERAGRIAKPEGQYSDTEWSEVLGALREQIAQLDPIERGELYSVALERNDPAPVAAIESAPPVLDKKTKSFIPAIDPALVRAKRIERGRKAYPDAAATRDRNEKLVASYRHSAGLIRSEIVKRVPAIDPRGIEVIK